MTPVRWLRISYRVGAAVDALAAAQMLAARAYGCGMAVRPFAPGDDFRWALGMGVPLMLGWTAVLLWADRSPLERRGVLPLTVLVIAGLAANQLVAVRAGFLALGPVAVVWVVQAALVVLFLWSYARAGRAASVTG